MATAAPSQHPSSHANAQGEGQVGRQPPPSFVPTPRVVSSQADAGAVSASTPKATPAEILPAKAGDKSGFGRGNDRLTGSPDVGMDGIGTNGSPGAAPGGGVAAAGDSGDGVSSRAGAILTNESGSVECRASGGGSDSSDGQTVLQVGERLQEAVRLCIAVGDGSRDGEGARPGAPCALTLTEAELSRPRRLLEDLRRLSSRSDGAGGAQHEAHGGAGGGDVAAADAELGSRRGMTVAAAPKATAAVAVWGAEKTEAVLGHALADTEAQRRRSDGGEGGGSGASAGGGGAGGGGGAAIGDPLMMETSWLGDRLVKATLGDLLASRLELSLWASFRRRGRSAGPSG